MRQQKNNMPIYMYEQKSTANKSPYNNENPVMEIAYFIFWAVWEEDALIKERLIPPILRFHPIYHLFNQF